MIQYVSTNGGTAPVNFDEAVLSGFAADGGLYVPESIPQISKDQLYNWQDLNFTDLAFEILSLFIDRKIIPSQDLQRLIEQSFSSFDSSDVIEMVRLNYPEHIVIAELFNGPTLSFKDIAMGFLINALDYFLNNREEHLSIVLATTGDTGPAAAWACAGKETLDCWPLFPRGMITEEQERQMTTLNAHNVHPVGVENCNNGGDDLDAVVATLFADQTLKQKLNLSSVNSINWCRVMVQSVHYFYAYYRTVDNIGDEITFSVPSGAFGNLFGGYLARSMGLPVHCFICANNANHALHTVISEGLFAKKNVVQTISSAIDIAVPYNFWRYLYFCTGKNSKILTDWMNEFNRTGQVSLSASTLATVQQGFASLSISDEDTRNTIRTVYESNNGYLLDPHTAVAVAAASSYQDKLPGNAKIVCLATAHPAKFPEIMQNTLGTGSTLPQQARHTSLEKAAKVCQHLRLCDLQNLEFALVDAMTQQRGSF